MFFIKNAVKNIYRYKNKYIMFGILFFITICAASVTINLYLSMEKITDNLLKAYCGTVRIISHEREHLSKSEYIEYESSSYVEEVKIFQYNFYTNGSYLEKQIFDTENIQIHMSGGIKTFNSLVVNPVFVCGYDLSLLYLADIDFNILEGRMFENEDECVIVQNLSDIYSFYIGDKIVFEIPGEFYKEFTITGIIQESLYNYSRFIRTTLEGAEYFENIPVTDKPDYVAHGDGPPITLGYDAVVCLKNYKDYADFSLKVQEESQQARAVKPLYENFDTIRNLINDAKTWNIIFTILIAIIITAITIISTIILLNSRKYEIAVLRSVGMKKSRLTINYLVENLAFVWGITIISFTMAQFISRIFTRGIFAGMQNLMSAESFEKLTQGVNLELFLQNAGLVFGGTTAIVILSLILACINIIRFEPLKIFNRQY